MEIDAYIFSIKDIDEKYSILTTKLKSNGEKYFVKVRKRDILDEIYPYDKIITTIKEDEEGNSIAVNPIVFAGNSEEYYKTMINRLCYKLPVSKNKVPKIRDAIITYVEKSNNVCSFLTSISSNMINNHVMFHVNEISSLLGRRNDTISKFFNLWYKHHYLRLLNLINIKEEYIISELFLFNQDDLIREIISFPFKFLKIPIEICMEIVEKFKVGLNNFEEIVFVAKKLRLQEYDLELNQEIQDLFCLTVTPDGTINHMIDLMYHDRISKSIDIIHVQNQEPIKVIDVNDPYQQEALRIVSENNISCIRGGAGTGKTTTIMNICKMFAKAHTMCTVVAYTGKAASRIRECCRGKINARISTIHKYLTKPIETKVMIIDEASMVDYQTFIFLIEVLVKNENVPRLILVGDPNQLPPISYGNPFNEFIRDYPEVKLMTNFRSKNSLSKFLNLITEKGLFKKVSNKGNIEMYFNSEKTVKDIVKELKLSGVSHDDITIISPYNIDVSIFNDLMEKEFLLDKTKLFLNNRRIYNGQRMMMLQNDYDNDVMNGEEGTIIIADNLPFIKFNSRIFKIVLLNDKSMKKSIFFDHLVPSYSMTVHKSQGSEWKYVIFYIKKISPFISKELIYTAMSRAQERLYVVSDISYSRLKLQVEQK